MTGADSCGPGGAGPPVAGAARPDGADAARRQPAADGLGERPATGDADRAGRRRVLGHLPGRPARPQRVRQARAGEAQGRRRLAGAGRAQPLRGRVDAGGRGDRAGGGAADPRRGPRRGCFAMGYLDPDTNPVWKSLLRDGAIVRGHGRRGRRHARPHPRRHRRPGGHRGPVRDRRHLLRDPAGALPGRHRPRARRPGGAIRGPGRGHAHDQARPRPRRLQPEEHPDRRGRAGRSWTPNARGSAIRRSISRSCSTICC